MDNNFDDNIANLIASMLLSDTNTHNGQLYQEHKKMLDNLISY